MDAFTPRLDILPPTQRALWPDLRPAQHLGYVLYGGTAIALRLGHRQSLDFDFFNSRPLDRKALQQSLSFLQNVEVRQDSLNTFEVETAAGVKVSFFGGLDFGRAGEPERTSDGIALIASLTDLMATKLKVILQRSEAKDYQDIAAMIRAKVRVDFGLAAAEQMFKPTFPPTESLKAMVYFQDGDLKLLSLEDREVLTTAANRVKTLPRIILQPDLAPSEVTARYARTQAESQRNDPPRQGPKMSM